MASTTFHYENCELDFGAYSLGGDWLLTVETGDDGFSFKLVDAESQQAAVDKEALPLIQKWIDLDTAPRARGSEHKSRIRSRFEDHMRTADEARADDLGCHLHHQRAA